VNKNLRLSSRIIANGDLWQQYHYTKVSVVVALFMGFQSFHKQIFQLYPWKSWKYREYTTQTQIGFFVMFVLFITSQPRTSRFSSKATRKFRCKLQST